MHQAFSSASSGHNIDWHLRHFLFIEHEPPCVGAARRTDKKGAKLRNKYYVIGIPCQMGHSCASVDVSITLPRKKPPSTSTLLSSHSDLDDYIS